MTSPIGEDDLAAWIDGRLSPERQRLVDAYLEGQPDVHARLREQAEQARALTSLFAPIADEPIPATMRVAAIRGRQRQPRWQLAIAASLLLAVGFGGGWSSARWSGEPRAGIAALANEASDNFRVYAADRIRPAEIGPDQRAMLIRWTSARLGERVTIPDLSTAGYRYGGGRLVATPHGPAVLLLYDGPQASKLAVLTRPMQIDKSASMTSTSSGTMGRVTWAVDGIGYSVVGERPAAELHPIADEVRRQADAGLVS